MDGENKSTLIIELEALPLQGPTKTKEKLAKETFETIYHIWKNSTEECLCDVLSVRSMDVSERGT